MTKNVETGHARNVENFKRLQEYIAGFGSKYAPGDARLQPANITLISQNSAATMEAVNAATPPYLQAVSRREQAFANIPSLASRALQIAETLHIDAASLNALKELVRKLHGRRATPKKTEAQQEHKTISISHLSFDQRTEHFAQFVALLAAESAYQPAETELSVTAFTAHLAEMRAANEAVTQTSIPPANARNARNTVLYAPLTGLVDVAHDVKRYVRAAFGNDSGEYKEIKSLEFKKQSEK
ncbi:MAG: hypothetical protein LBF08_02070 [Dysgonamonadaceae bacterium]|jgi:hypothetical protein|nr:hypothetical protein [Dysgonamonadaceae bacterium]